MEVQSARKFEAKDLAIRVAWGKLDRRAGGQAWLSLISHSADVASVTLALLKLPSWRRYMESFAERSLTDQDLERLTVLSFLHDIGKCALGFWLKQLDVETSMGQKDRSARLEALRICNGKPESCGHINEVLALRDQSFKSKAIQALPLEHIQSWGGFCLWRAAISHHGDPLPESDGNATPYWTWNAAFGFDPFAQLQKLTRCAQKWFPKAFEDGPALPESKALVHAFAGLVSLADWIGSNPEPGFFPYDLAGEDNRFEVAKIRAQQVLTRMQLDVDETRRSLQNSKQEFQSIFCFKPSPLQQAMARLDLGPLVIAESETGSGKTEAALWRFLTLFEAGHVDGFAFTLPTRVSAVQIEERANEFLQRAFPDPMCRPNLVLAVPGYLISDGVQGEKLAHFRVLWPDQDQDASAHRHWAAENPKRYLAAAASVGTIDQVLMSGLKIRHSHLRGMALTRSLLIVDEVHASDVYMNSVLTTVLRRHINAGGHALLLSATLGGAARRQFLRAHLNIKALRSAEAQDQSDVEATPYPCLSGIDVAPIALDPEASLPERQKRVFHNLQGWMKAPNAVAQYAAEAVRAGAKVLIMRNTVAAVIETQLALEQLLGPEHPALFRCQGIVAPHHGRFAALDRKLLDAAVKDHFGKDSTRDARVLVGSQTLEQSLDIDADLLITDLCPMDVLLQRIGRLHRHKRERPVAFSTAQVLVLTPAERDLTPVIKNPRGSVGLGTVYSNFGALEATWQELLTRPDLQIPLHNRALVEACTDPSTLEKLCDSLGEHWSKAQLNLQGKTQAQQGAASNAVLDWLSGDFKPFPQDEDIKSRLGASTRVVKLQPECASPFQPILRELQFPAWLWPKDCEVSETSAQSVDGAVTLQLAGIEFIYDRLGLRKNSG